MLDSTGNGNEAPTSLGGLGDFTGLPRYAGAVVKITLGITALVVFIVLLNIGRVIYTNILWFDSLGLQSVYTTILYTRIWLFFAGFLVMAGLLVWTFRYAYKASWGPSQLMLPPLTLAWLQRGLVVGM